MVQPDAPTQTRLASSALAQIQARDENGEAALRSFLMQGMLQKEDSVARYVLDRDRLLSRGNLSVLDNTARLFGHGWFSRVQVQKVMELSCSDVIFTTFCKWLPRAWEMPAKQSRIPRAIGDVILSSQI
jgi:hypothetical protein